MSTMNETVVLVDQSGNEIGTADKRSVHHTGELHRAFSVFLYDGEGRQLIQQRAFDKYHSAGLWSNACCSHPRPGETPIQAAHRRLMEELGARADIRPLMAMRYRAALDNGMVEHEYDHIFVGRLIGDVTPNPSEVADVRWVNGNELMTWFNSEPESFTKWFRLALPEVRAARQNTPTDSAKSLFCPDGTVATFLFQSIHDVLKGGHTPGLHVE